MKRWMSFLLVLCLMLSAATVVGAVDYHPADHYTVSNDTPTCEEAIMACNNDELGEVQKVYFQLPAAEEGNEATNWTNKYNSTDLGLDYCQVCAYWWNGVGSVWPDGTTARWVGYKAKPVDKENRIYEAVLPADGETSSVIWNNGVYGGTDSTKEIFKYARQLADANIEGAEPGDYDTLPEGSPKPDSMDGCIAVSKKNEATTAVLIDNQPYQFDWYVYYGDGCYGEYPTTSDHFLNKEENCVNPEHHHIKSGHIYFDAASAGWENADSILFYIHEIGGEELGAWGSKKLKGTKGSNNIWSFDAAGLGVKEGKQYGLIMNNEIGSMCCDLLMDTTCFGDTVIADNSVHLENPFDSNKFDLNAKWKNSSYGPILQITSIGSIVGESIPASTSAYQMMVNFLASRGRDGLNNALCYNGKDARTTIEDVAKVLGLSESDIKKAVIQARDVGNPLTGDKMDWTKEYPVSDSTAGDASGSSSSGSSSSSSSSGKASSTAYTAYPKVTVKTVSDGLEVTWTSVKGASWYRVFIKSGSSFKKLIDVKGNGFIATNVKSGTKYTYTVRALSNDRKVCTSDYVRKGVSRTYIAAPKFSVTNAADGVTVKWSKVTGAAKYRVLLKDGSSWKKLADTKSLTYTHKGVKSGKAYTYTVRCISSDGKSYTSAAPSGKKVTFLTAPKFSLSKTKSGVKITWSKVAGAAKYRVFIKSGKSWKKLKDTTALTATDTSVKSGKSYTYTVRCLSKDGKSYTSAYRAGKSIKFSK